MAVFLPSCCRVWFDRSAAGPGAGRPCLRRPARGAGPHSRGLRPHTPPRAARGSPARARVLLSSVPFSPPIQRNFSFTPSLLSEAPALVGRLGGGAAAASQPTAGEGEALHGGQGEPPPAEEPPRGGGRDACGLASKPFSEGESDPLQFLKQGGGRRGVVNPCCPPEGPRSGRRSLWSTARVVHAFKPVGAGLRPLWPPPGGLTRGLTQGRVIHTPLLSRNSRNSRRQKSVKKLFKNNGLERCPATLYRCLATLYRFFATLYRSGATLYRFLCQPGVTNS